MDYFRELSVNLKNNNIWTQDRLRYTGGNCCWICGHWAELWVHMWSKDYYGDTESFTCVNDRNQSKLLQCVENNIKHTGVCHRLNSKSICPFACLRGFWITNIFAGRWFSQSQTDDRVFDSGSNDLDQRFSRYYSYYLVHASIIAQTQLINQLNEKIQRAQSHYHSSPLTPLLRLQVSESCSIQPEQIPSLNSHFLATDMVWTEGQIWWKKGVCVCVCV